MDFSSLLTLSNNILTSLTPNICSQDAIEKLQSSGNVDNPEGGLDALVQVAVCEKVSKYILLPKREGSTGRISARDLNSTCARSVQKRLRAGIHD